MHFNDIIGCTSHEIKYSIKIFKKRKREKKRGKLDEIPQKTGESNYNKTVSTY